MSKLKFLPGKLVAGAVRSYAHLIAGSARPPVLQQITLRRLLQLAGSTEFGKHYHFESMLRDDSFQQLFSAAVPLYQYNSMFSSWWHRTLSGEENVCWPGRTSYFALSSGTSQSASKSIPVTGHMLRSTRKVGLLQLANLSSHLLPPSILRRQVLMVGGSTALSEQNGQWLGDMSGISMLHMPGWFARHFARPGKQISDLRGWPERLEAMVKAAPLWDVGVVCGIPCWVQILLKEIVTRYRLAHIRELWPHFSLYVHGGVAIEPYRAGISDLAGQKLSFTETYMASEGSFGFRTGPDREGIRLIPHAGIYYEFIHFNERNFDEQGNIKGQPVACTLAEVKAGVPYAMVISTCAGAWRYVIGDVVQFTDVYMKEIVILGRTSQFLNVCGEHVSIHNLSQTIELVCSQLEIKIDEFAVAAVKEEEGFTYRWFIASKMCADQKLLQRMFDGALCSINDDYSTARAANLLNLHVEVLPPDIFYGFLRSQGKEGGMFKFPRVLSGTLLSSWLNYLQQHSYQAAGTLL